MSHAVRLSALALEDLVGVHCWIVREAGQGVADGYLDRSGLDRIGARITTLADFPLRGTPRDDLTPGVRTLSFERRLLIAYRVDDIHVDVLRVIDAVRDLAQLLG